MRAARGRCPGRRARHRRRAAAPAPHVATPVPVAAPVMRPRPSSRRPHAVVAQPCAMVSPPGPPRPSASRPRSRRRAGAAARGQAADQRADNFGAVSLASAARLRSSRSSGRSEGPVYRLTSPVTDIGRHGATSPPADDPTLSAVNHARFQRRNDRHYLPRPRLGQRDLPAHHREPSRSSCTNDVVLVGQQVLRVGCSPTRGVARGRDALRVMLFPATPERPWLARGSSSSPARGVARDITTSTATRPSSAASRATWCSPTTCSLRRHCGLPARPGAAARRRRATSGAPTARWCSSAASARSSTATSSASGTTCSRFDAAPRGAVVGAGAPPER